MKMRNGILLGVSLAVLAAVAAPALARMSTPAQHPTTEDIVFTAMTLQSVGDTENAIAVLLPLVEKAIGTALASGRM
jgi:hypothetical protein